MTQPTPASRYTPPIRRRETAKGHYYVDAAGQRVPGVTTIIGSGVPKPALIEWAGNATAEAAIDQWDDLTRLPPGQRLAVLRKARYGARDQAKDRGTEVHKAAEKLLAGQSAQVGDDIAGHVEHYARFLDAFQVRPQHIEFSCVSYRWGYAGTADLYAQLDLPDHGPSWLLIDLKTGRSGIFGEVALQLAAYRYADCWVLGNTADGWEEITPPNVDFCAGLHVRGDGYDLFPVDAGPEQHKAFLHAMRVGTWSAGSRDLIGPAITPPTTTTKLTLLRERT